jgi:hypothetical protein
MNTEYKTRYFKRQNSKAFLMKSDEFNQRISSYTKPKNKIESFEIEEIDIRKNKKTEIIFQNLLSFEYERSNRVLEIFRYVSIGLFVIPILVRS